MPNIYSYIVKRGQNMVDVSMQVYGRAESVIDLCVDNGLEVGQEVLPGTELIIDSDKIANKKLVQYYQDQNITISSE